MQRIPLRIVPRLSRTPIRSIAWNSSAFCVLKRQINSTTTTTTDSLALHRSKMSTVAASKADSIMPQANTAPPAIATTRTPEQLLASLHQLLARTVSGALASGQLPQDSASVWHNCQWQLTPNLGQKTHNTHYSATVVRIANQYYKLKQLEQSPQQQQQSQPNQVNGATTMSPKSTISNASVNAQTALATSTSTIAERKAAKRQLREQQRTQHLSSPQSKLAQQWAQILCQQFKLQLTQTQDAILQRSLQISCMDTEQCLAQQGQGSGQLMFCVRDSLFHSSPKSTKRRHMDMIRSKATDLVNNSSATPSSPTASASSASEEEQFTFRSVGVIHSCFKAMYGTPRQGNIVTSSRCTVQLHRHMSPHTLDGLDEYSHVWVLFVFHLNTNKSCHSKIAPPRMLGEKSGVFATRSPHRPNPIGMTLCKIESVDCTKRCVHLSGIDLIEGTPVIDLKPVHPSEQLPQTLMRVPAWQNEAPLRPLKVTMLPSAAQQLQSFVSQLEFYESYAEIEAAIVESISCDPRPVFLKQKTLQRGHVYGLRVDRLNVLFQVNDTIKQPGTRQQHQQAIVTHVDFIPLGPDGDEDAATKKLLDSRPQPVPFQWHQQNGSAQPQPLAAASSIQQCAAGNTAES